MSDHLRNTAEKQIVHTVLLYKHTGLWQKSNRESFVTDTQNKSTQDCSLSQVFACEKVFSFSWNPNQRQKLSFQYNEYIQLALVAKSMVLITKKSSDLCLKQLFARWSSVLFLHGL